LRLEMIEIDEFSQILSGNLTGHESRVTSISLTNDGMALASGSWDTSIRIWV